MKFINLFCVIALPKQYNDHEYLLFIQLSDFNQAFMDKLGVKPFVECLYSEVSTLHVFLRIKSRKFKIHFVIHINIMVMHRTM